MDVFQVGGRYSTKITPPILACKRCGAVLMVKAGQTQVVCKCGKQYQLMAAGRPVQKLHI